MKYPSKTAVVALLDRMQNLLFPGYFDEIDDVDALTAEVQSSLAVLLDVAQARDAIHTAAVFMQKMPTIKEMLDADVEALYDGDPAADSHAEIILSYPGLYATMVYRIAHELHLLSAPLLPRMMTEHAHSSTGIDIHPGAKIGKYFCMDHGTGIVIGETSEIGENVKIYQGVTIGALSTKGGRQKMRGVKRHPTIKNDVTIYAGATILGGDTVIGEGTVIGGNTFIVSSVPANAVARMENPELIVKTGGEPNLRDV